MFCHGINYKFLRSQYPVLSPRLTMLKQSKVQQLDRKHLIEQFGFEPVHFLETSAQYTLHHCLHACLEFGNVVFVYHKLPLPLLQLSPHEVGVPTMDTRKADYIFVENSNLLKKLKHLYPYIPIYYGEKTQLLDKNKTISVWRKSVPSVKIK